MGEAARVIVMTPDELRAIVRDAVQEALDKRAADTPDSEIMTRAEVAEMLGVHEASITTYAKKHGLPGVKLAGGEWRFRRSQVMAWMESKGNR